MLTQSRDLNANITKNFKYGEFIKSSIARQYGIPIYPTEQQWQNIERLAKNLLQPLADRFGPIRVNSGIRPKEVTFAARDFERYKYLKQNDPQLLSKLISETNSLHTNGYAADIEPLDRDIPLLDLVVYAHKMLPYTQIIAEYFPTGWVHIAYWETYQNSDRPRGLLLLKDKTHNYTRVTIDELIKYYG